MGTYYYWACPERKQYIDADCVGDNEKHPVDQAAYLAFELLRTGRWPSARVYRDTVDLPWEINDGWTEVGGRPGVGGWELAGVHWLRDEPVPGVYRSTRTVDERAGGIDRAPSCLPGGSLT